ncbi:unnamed protein product [Fusarium graminearum]|uniref:Uncharacterized protein n=1 Tax=Gibberella zeae TaxID=5518 RepID=A0A4E9ED02_GIBZA|nr:unnamed protein product [Fusarium graminearum]CAF3590578.1 unnamed protein product [Fusarium graminearum]CAG1961547.1 unnamed protein product [Fusarium graminearum]CAG1963348.1 unnamed protein product [Fusarium graminearum]
MNYQEDLDRALGPLSFPHSPPNFALLTPIVYAYVTLNRPSFIQTDSPQFQHASLTLVFSLMSLPNELRIAA